MKTAPNKSVRELRRVIGQTQAEFAAMIGASKDTVVSWETGRNKLSATFARRIACATGVDGKYILSGKGMVITGIFFDEVKDYSAEDFKLYRETAWGRSDEEGARQHLVNCVDALELLFMAAGKAGGEKQRLPGVLDSFMQWCEETRKDFQLEGPIEEELEKRKFKMGMTATYWEWRQRYRADPEALTELGFIDDPQKGEREELRLTMEAVPGWAPGQSMKTPNPAVKIAVTRKKPKAVGGGWF